MVLECNVCGNRFKRHQNVALVSSRPRHYCNMMCHSLAMKSGGVADESRKKSCRQAYGSDYYITRSDVASKNGKLAHTPEIESRRWKKIFKSWETSAVSLKRGLTLTRSRQEIAFFEALSRVVGPIEYQKHINGWFIDGYVPTLDVWIQFDGVYWHSKPNHVVKDNAQNSWFRAQDLLLVRITDVEWKNDPVGVVDRVVRMVGLRRSQPNT